MAKSCYDANNKRNNDLFGVTKANGLLSFDLPTIVQNGKDSISNNTNLTEEAMVAYLDNKDKLESED